MKTKIQFILLAAVFAILCVGLDPDSAAAQDANPEKQKAEKKKEGSKKTGAGQKKPTAPKSKAKSDPAKKPADDPKPAPPAKKPAPRPPAISDTWIKGLDWRPIGPASMGGRIVDLAVLESNPSTFYIATASGGLFRTANNGTTFDALFENQNTVSIGDVALSQSDPNTIWVGTGEHNARNSASWGDGVYKTVDGGKTWSNMGLKKSFQIGRIAIHPTDPDTVYVGALGRLWGPNEERGVYQTTNGGKSWDKVLHVDNQTGCIDLAMHPNDPNTLLAAMYERRRDGFDGNDPVKRWGPGSGLYKTTDGGANWKKLTKGLPKVELGRIGIEYFERDPNTVYVIVESEKIGDGPASAFMGITGSESPAGGKIRSVVKGGPAQKAGMKDGDTVIKMDDDEIKTYNDLIVKIRSHKAGDTVKLNVRRDEETKQLELTFGKRSNASSRPFSSYLGGQRANAMKQQGEKGNDTGGVYKSTDGGESWKRINSLNPRPFYYSQLIVDPSDDQHMYVMGVRFHESHDGGATFKTGGKRVHADHHALWVNPRDSRRLILGCDGGLYMSYDRGQTWDFHNIMDIGQFYDVGVDTRNPYWVYGGLQDNGSWAGPSRKRGGYGPLNEDWLKVGGGDGFLCRVDPDDPATVYYESQGGNMSRMNMKTGARTRIKPPTPKGMKYRFNWKTPFALSHHNSKIFYSAGNYVFRSLDRGGKPRRISPEITRTDRGSATALSESPRDSNLLYVGTDDGFLWITRNGGSSWTNITKNVGLSDHYWVSSIEASRFVTGRAYVAFDGHRSNSDDPLVYATEDYGKTWTPLNKGLPTGSTRVLREDRVNKDLLYLGTEFAVWASVDRGRQWEKINNNLPTVAIHEIAVHPTANEIVAATHGRSLWILDIAPLRELSSKLLAAKAHLFKPPSGVLWAGALTSTRGGHRYFSGANGEFGAPLRYYLGDAAKEVKLEIVDIKGRRVRGLKTDVKPGLHRVQWNLRADPPKRSSGSSSRARTGPSVRPGVYLAKLTVDGKEFVEEIRVNSDPDFPAAMLLEELNAFEAKERPGYLE